MTADAGDAAATPVRIEISRSAYERLGGLRDQYRAELEQRRSAVAQGQSAVALLETMLADTENVLDHCTIRSS